MSQALRREGATLEKKYENLEKEAASLCQNGRFLGSKGLEASNRKIDDLANAQDEIRGLVLQLGAQSPIMPSSGGSEDKRGHEDLKEAETLWQCIFSQQAELMALQEQLRSLKGTSVPVKLTAADSEALISVDIHDDDRR